MPAGLTEEQQLYHWYAEAYGWEPEKVRKLSMKEDFWLRMQKEAVTAAQAALDREAELVQ